MQNIETKEIGEYNLDYFSADITVDGNFYFGGKKFELGQFTTDLLNLGNDFRTELIILSAQLYELSRDMFIRQNGSADEYAKVKNKIYEIIDKIKNVKPFSYFNIEYSRKVVDDFFATNDFRRIKSIIQIYCYIGGDVANYTCLAASYTETLMSGTSRQNENLVACAYMLFTNPEMIKKFNSANPMPYIEGITLRPRVTQVPIIQYREDKNTAIITRRLYFGRLMDFFVTEFFEGLQHGHYMWRCKVCGKYFLMTSARRQLYCSEVNKKFGVPCSYVAKHPERINRTLEKESVTDTRLDYIRNKTRSAIRKRKSRGTLDTDVAEKALRLANEKYETARIDFDYADINYENEMEINNIIKEIKSM